MQCIKMYILHTDVTSQQYDVLYDKYKHCLQATGTGRIISKDSFFFKQDPPLLFLTGYRYRFTLDPLGTLSLTRYRYRFTLDPLGTLSLTGYRYRFTIDPLGTRPLTGYRYRFTLDPLGTGNTFSHGVSV